MFSEAIGIHGSVVHSIGAAPVHLGCSRFYFDLYRGILFESGYLLAFMVRAHDRSSNKVMSP